MANTDDFSFPTFTHTLPCGIDSPPLWRLSPTASPDSYQQERSKGSTREEEEDDDDHEEMFKDCFPTTSSMCTTERKSFSCIEKGINKLVIRRDGGDREDDKVEKMDMLWEDFNEELLSRSYSSRLDSDHVVNMGCVQALRLSESSGDMLSPRKPSFTVFMKALKKVFLLQHSHASVKPHASHRPITNKR